MLKIRDFAKLGEVSMATLRYYDEIGLLKPSLADPETGYRFYTVDQLLHLHRILALKELGSHLEAASLPLAVVPAREALINRAHLKAGETLLIHGGAGGVGSLAIQIGRAVGATVFATCRGSNREFVKLLGAEEAIDYTQEDAAEGVNRLTQNAGVDVVLDAVGKERLSRSIAMTKRFGRLVSITGPTGDLNAGYFKNVAIHFASCQRARSTLESLRALVEQGGITPVVDTVLPLHEVALAHQRLERGGVRGKIVLQVD